MARSTSLNINVTASGVRETLAALNRLPKDANAELREQSLALARTLVPKMQAAARSDESPQAKLLARTVKARRDRVPVIVAGGTTRVGSGRRRAPAWKLLFGSEFGSNQYPQFGKRHNGRQGSWIFGTVNESRDDMFKAWQKAADKVIRKFGGA